MNETRIEQDSKSPEKVKEGVRFQEFVESHLDERTEGDATRIAVFEDEAARMKVTLTKSTIAEQAKPGADPALLEQAKDELVYIVRVDAEPVESEVPASVETRQALYLPMYDDLIFTDQDENFQTPPNAEPGDFSPHTADFWIDAIQTRFDSGALVPVINTPEA